MASSVNRRIKTDLVSSLGHRDPAGMIRPRSTDPIRARGHVPQIQAGHMTASDRQSQNAKKPLLAGGHPHMTESRWFFARGRLLHGAQRAGLLLGGEGGGKQGFALLL